MALLDRLNEEIKKKTTSYTKAKSVVLPEQCLAAIGPIMAMMPVCWRI